MKLVIFLSAIWIVLNYFLLNRRSDQNFVKNNNQCSGEWIKLNENVYFRRSMAFYFTDLNKIRLYLERRQSSANLLGTIELHVEVKLKNNQYLKSNYKHFKQDIIKKDFDYSFESLEFDVILNESIQKENIKSGNVYVVEIKNIDKTTISLPIPLHFKASRLKNEKIVKKNFLCSDLRRGYTRNDVNSFRWHIEMHILNGYDKLIIYNNTMEDSEEYNRLFREYIDYVQIIQYKCMPNFYDKSKQFITNFYELDSQSVAYRWHFETLVYMECYVHHMDKYNYITLNDHDEIIIPRYFEPNAKLEKISENKCNYPNENKLNKTDLQIYLDSLKKSLNLNGDFSFHFKMGIFMKMRLIDYLFQQYELLINSNSYKNEIKYPYSFRVIDALDGIDFNCKISDKNEHDYALYLLNIYKTLLQPLKKKFDSISDLISEAFNRHFYLKGQSTNWLFGKTVHNTKLTNTLTHHYPSSFTKDSIAEIPIQLGHLSHFRRTIKNYLDFKNDVSITELHFDLDYFFCYYKPILKKLGFKF